MKIEEVEMSNIRKIHLDNEKGKILYEKTILEYSKLIVEEIRKEPNRLPILLDKLGITKEEFYSLISSQKKGNITFYDESLQILKK